MDERQNIHPVQVPASLTDLDGPYVSGRARVISMRKGEGMADIQELSAPVEWCGECDSVVFRALRDGNTLN